MTTVFKKGDRVYDYEFGHGEIVEITTHTSYPVHVRFNELSANNIVGYTKDGELMNYHKWRRLSFREYNFVSGGFTQERQA